MRSNGNGHQRLTGQRTPTCPHPWTAARCLSLLGIAASIGACDVGDDVERVTKPLMEDHPIDAGLTTRHMAVDVRCSHFICVKRQGLKCVEYGDCVNEIWGAKLYSDVNAMAAETPFPEYYEGPEWKYRGCGPQAAMNVLSYAGVYLPIEEVAQNMNNIDLPFSDQIATKPDRVVDGLQYLLNTYAQGNFTVRRRSGSQNDVANALRQTGYPVIVLGENGGHYVTVTGYESRATARDMVNYDPFPAYFHIVDYRGGARDVIDLGMNFGTFPAWASILTLGDGGYQSDTFITIERS